MNWYEFRKKTGILLMAALLICSMPYGGPKASAGALQSLKLNRKAVQTESDAVENPVLTDGMVSGGKEAYTYATLSEASAEEASPSVALDQNSFDEWKVTGTDLGDSVIKYCFTDYEKKADTDYLLLKGLEAGTNGIIHPADFGITGPYRVYAWPEKEGAMSGKSVSNYSYKIPSGVEASPLSGHVDAGTSVTLSTGEEGCAVYYTTDGSIPDQTSIKYSGPITIAEDTTLTAAAFYTDPDKTYEKGWVGGKVTVFQYEIGAVTNDKYEPNNELSTAYALTFPGRYNAMISTATDKDYYSFTIDSDMSLNLSLSLPAGVKYGLKLLDGTGSEIAESTASDAQSIKISSCKKGSYYALVYSLDSSSSDKSEYTLRLFRKYDNLNSQKDFSEANMAAAYFSKPGGAQSPYSGSRGNMLSGGTPLMATNYLSSWDGPVDETLQKYWGTASDTEDTKYKEYKNLGKTSDYHLQTAIFGPTADRDSNGGMTPEEQRNHIKNMIYTYGAVSASLNYSYPYFDKTLTNSYQKGTDYENAPDGTALGGGHAITLVGWDDDYPAENFGRDTYWIDTYHLKKPAQQLKPENNGAWIVKNSHGEDRNDGGFFYVSYESEQLMDDNPVAYLMEEGTDNYNREYKNDPSGGSTLNFSDTGTVETENTFTTDGKAQLLKAVSDTAWSGDLHTTFYVTVNGIKTKIAEGTQKYAGYYTHRLERPVYLPANTDFTITEVLYSTDKDHAEITVPYDYAEEHTAGRAYMYLSDNGKKTETSSLGFYPCTRAFTVVPGEEKNWKVISLTNHTDTDTISKLSIYKEFCKNTFASNSFSGLSGSEGGRGSVYGLAKGTIAYSVSAINTDGLPSKFDLRDINAVSSVKSQGDYGICWTFAACAAEESNILLHAEGRLDYNRTMTLESDQNEDILLTASEPEKTVVMTANLLENVGDGNEVYWYLSGDTDSVEMINDKSMSGSSIPVFRFIKAGKVTVTASAGVDVNATATKEFTATEEGISSIQLDRETLYLPVNGKYQLKASVLPVEARNKTLVWSSDNADTVFVDNSGNVLGLRNGSALITVKGGTAEASCRVTVGNSSDSSGAEGKDQGTNYTDPVKGHMNTLTGILTGNENGYSKWISITDPQTGAITWKLQYANGTNAAGTWEKVDGQWYKFDAGGTMQTGWILDGEKWYYLDSVKGDMKTGFLTDPTDQHQYYLNPDGSLATGWIEADGKWYYYNADPLAATYVYDAASGKWIWKGGSGIPYGALLKNTTTPDNRRVDETGARIG